MEAIRHYWLPFKISILVFAASFLFVLFIQPDYMKKQWNKAYLAATEKPKANDEISQFTTSLKKYLKNHKPKGISQHDINSLFPKDASKNDSSESEKQIKFFIVVIILEILFVISFSILSILLGAAPK